MNQNSRLRQVSAVASRCSAGFATIPVLVFLAVAVVFLLTQTLSITGSKVTDDVAHHDSIRALYIAESGLEFATGVVSAASVSFEKLEQVCKALDDLSPPAGLELRDGLVKIKYLSFEAPPENSDIRRCEFSTTGVFGNATRVLVKKGTFERQKGIAGFGGYSASRDAIQATVANDQSAGGYAIFNLAWRRSGSDGLDPLSCDGQPDPCELKSFGDVLNLGGQTDALPCTGCPVQWNIESSSGGPSVGSLGTIKSLTANTDYTVTQNLTGSTSGGRAPDRNFVEVGTILIGTTNTADPLNDSRTTMSRRGSYSNVSTSAGGSARLTTDNSSSSNPTGGTTNGSFKDYEPTSTVTTGGATLTGTITSFTTGSGTVRKTVTGNATLFETEAPVGSALKTASGVTIGTVSAVSSNTSLTLAANALVAVSGSTYNISSTIPGYTHDPSGVICDSSTGATCNNWCHRADTLIFGVSGRSNPTSLITAGLYAAELDRVTFGERSGGTGGLDLTRIATYPNVTKPTPGANGDIFAQVWAGYNPFFIARVTAVSGSTVTLDLTDPRRSIAFDQDTFNTTDPLKYTVVGGWNTTAVPVDTKVVGYDGAAGSITLNKSVPLAVGDVICGGICAFFNTANSANSVTTFRVRESPYVTQWAGGFSCFKGTNREQIRSIEGNASAVKTEWHEVIK